MKMVITGTHSTGKTTIAKKIADSFGLKYVRGDKAIEICQSRFPGKSVNELSLEEQGEFQRLMFQSFDEIFEEEDNCVTDGFHLTCLPYGMLYTNGKITQMTGYSEFVQKIVERSKQFDYIFYLPPEIALENDNFRPQDQALRIDIDKILYSLLQDFEYTTLSGTMEARTRKAGEQIGIENPLWKNYVVLEGLPRSGKTTQIRILQEAAKKLCKKLYVCERNNNEYMRTFKERRKNNWYDGSREMLKLHSEALKSDFRANNIEDRLADGQIVISDRQKFTTMTLFGALGVPRHILYEAVYNLPDAGRTFYLDVNPAISVMRSIQTEPNKPLKTDLDFQEKVRRLYMQYAKDHKFEIIQSSQNPECVSEIIQWKIWGDTM
jgi:thymidylate kinase